jgi:hypothetical protein
VNITDVPAVADAVEAISDVRVGAAVKRARCSSWASSGRSQEQPGVFMVITHGIVEKVAAPLLPRNAEFHTVVLPGPARIESVVLASVLNFDPSSTRPTNTLYTLP